MSTALVMAQVTEDWVSTSPPSRAHVTYHELGDRNEALSGGSADRGFAWALPDRLEAVSEAGDGTSQVLWALEAQLRLARSGRTQRDLADAVALEQALLLRTVEMRSTWPAGVLAVETGDAVTDVDETSGDALVSLTLTALVEEADVPTLPVIPNPEAGYVAQSAAASVAPAASVAVLLLTGSGQAVTLPPGASTTYQHLTIVDAGRSAESAPHTVTPAAGETIDGQATLTLGVAGESVSMVFYGADWVLV
jgi:hypothetical protein